MFSALLSFISRPGAQAAIHNLGWLAVEKLIRCVFGVVVGFWVARYLGPERFGSLNYALALVGIGMMLTEGGLEGVVRREMIHQPARVPALLATAGMIRLMLGGVGYLGLSIALVLGWGTTSDRPLLLVVALLLFQPALFTSELWFQVRLQSRVSVILQLGVLVVGAGARLVLIQRAAPLMAFAWVMVFEAGAGGLLLAWRAKQGGMKFAWESDAMALTRRLSRDAWPLLASGIAVAVYMRIDAVMLRQMIGERAVGYYAAGTKFTEIWFFLPGALAISVLPELLRSKAQGSEKYATRLQQYCDLSTFLAYGFAIPTALAAPWLIRWAYGAAYAESASILVVHVWVLVFAALGVVRGQFCINEGYTRFHLCATVTGAVLNVGLNLILIPHWGAVGAALATLFAQAAAAWISTFCFAPTRAIAIMQTRALFIPFRIFNYVTPVRNS